MWPGDSDVFSNSDGDGSTGIEDCCDVGSVADGSSLDVGDAGCGMTGGVVGVAGSVSAGAGWMMGGDQADGTLQT